LGGAAVAIKVFKLELAAEELRREGDSDEQAAARAIRSFMYEVSLHSKLQHPNVARCVGIVSDNPLLVQMVLQLYEGGDLSKLVRLRRGVDETKNDTGYDNDASSVVIKGNYDNGGGYEVKELDDSYDNGGESEAKELDGNYDNGEEYEAPDGKSYGGYEAPERHAATSHVECPELGPLLGPLPSWETRFLLVLDVAHGLVRLHTRGVVHRDLKTENVLIGKDGRAVIGDLGCAQADLLLEEHESDIVDSNAKDYVNAAAPEEFGSSSTRMSDVYSFGTLMFELLALRRPYIIFGKDYNKIKRAISSGKQERIPDDPECPAAYKELLSACWSLTPQDRPAIATVLAKLQGMGPAFNVPWQRILVPALEEQLEPSREELERYVPPMAGEEEEGASQCSVQEALERFLCDPSRTVLALFGLGGLGKSLSIKQLCVNLVQQTREGREVYFPILLRPGLTAWTHEKLQGSIETALRALGMTHSDAIAQLANTRFLFVLDGYDELAGTSTRNLPGVLELNRWPNAKLVVTSRPDAVSAAERVARFGVKGQLAQMHLSRFAGSQVTEYLKRRLKWGDEQMVEFQRLTNTSGLLSVLENPFVLSMYAASYDSQKSLPSPVKRHHVYAAFVKHWVDRFEGAPVPRAELDCDLHSSLESWFKRVAVKMAQTGRLVCDPADVSQYPWSDWDAVINKHVDEQFAKGRDGVRSLLSGSQYHGVLKDRLAEALLSCPLKTGDQLSFGHKSIFEYYLARAVVDFIQDALSSVSVPPGVVRADLGALQFLEEMASPELLARCEQTVATSQHSGAVAATALAGLNHGMEYRSWRGAQLAHADLTHASLAHTDLTGANLHRAKLAECNFDGAIMNEADLSQVVPIDLPAARSCSAFGVAYF
jgi:serine/threonine protein kinase